MPNPIQDGDRVSVWLVAADGAVEDIFVEDDYLETKHRRRRGKAIEDSPRESVSTGSTLFIRGDCNSDGVSAAIDDALTLLEANFAGTADIACKAACDMNADDNITGVADAIEMLRLGFLGGAAPAAPYPGCGPSPSTISAPQLECASNPSCS